MFGTHLVLGQMPSPSLLSSLMSQCSLAFYPQSGEWQYFLLELNLNVMLTSKQPICESTYCDITLFVVNIVEIHLNMGSWLYFMSEWGIM